MMIIIQQQFYLKPANMLNGFLLILATPRLIMLSLVQYDHVAKSWTFLQIISSWTENTPGLFLFSREEKLWIFHSHLALNVITARKVVMSPHPAPSPQPHPHLPSSSHSAQTNLPDMICFPNRPPCTSAVTASLVWRRRVELPSPSEIRQTKKMRSGYAKVCFANRSH